MKRKKCLVIANDVGRSAPGKVFESILLELSNVYDITVISSYVRNNIPGCNKTIITSSFLSKLERVRITMLSFILFGRNILDDIWLFMQRKLIKKYSLLENDVVISLISNEHYKSLLLGYDIVTKTNKPWVVYSVDAIPAPLQWTNSKKYHQQTKKFIRKYLSYSNAIFSSNSQMLKYQLSLLDDYNGRSGIILTPSHISTQANSFSEKTTPVILYTGSIYGPRKVDAVIEGFKLFLNDCPKAKIIFVGSKSPSFFNKYHQLIKSGNLEIHGYTNDLSKYYNIASILLDINAYFDDDVFLSSKIVNYLPTLLPIVSITGLNSPSRLIFTNDNSIIHCRHEQKEIYNALKKASSIKSIDLDRRIEYISMFETQNVIEDFVHTINDLVSDGRYE